MKKKVLKATSLGVLLLVLNGMLVNATEEYALPDAAYAETSHESDAVNVEIFMEEEIQEMLSNSEADIKSLDAAVEPDDYEPNDSIETAYPYSEMERMTGNKFIEGYRHANCHVRGDQDFFSITLYNYCTYDVVLKNLYGQDRRVLIWESNRDGSWSIAQNPDHKTGEPECWRYTPSRSGTHYIQIIGGGVEECHYFFAVEKEGTINTALWPGDV